MNQLRNSIYTKFLWGLMGLYLLNFSVDPVDLYPEQIPEDLSINEQESIIEIIVEQILGYEDAIGEYDDTDTEDYGEKTTIKIDFIAQTSGNSGNNQFNIKRRKQKFPVYTTHLTNGFQELSTPPPKI
ncbi:hypothetical protein ACQY1Q_02290 [Tenacibaculum sp. TC6]|uniref:hypothetical protein n=1 Tax=Tenacibaculum sp. TC6 TaxID=3423223 RepID=UPI003D35B6E8